MERNGSREREWVIAPPHPDCARLASEMNVAPLLAQVLLNRGVDSLDSLRCFLHPEMRRLEPPEMLPNAVEAAERLARAVRQRRRIVIYGDYDVDGITATTILWHVLHLAGAEVSFYIPRRLEEGYGLNTEALRTLAADGAQTVITVDCGITAAAEAAVARELGLELILTDHHEFGAALPAADCLVHPGLNGSESNRDLSGAGVAFKVAWALARAISGGERTRPEFREFLIEATAFAALGLVADIVPLTGENRIIASFGLRQLCHTRNAGLKALIEVAGLAGKASYDDYDVGFRLAPRLNALGRLGHAYEAVELFTQADPARAKEIAQRLDEQNRRRQEVERGIAREAEELVRQHGFDRDGYHGIVLADERWHAGVIGIVASRLVDRFCRPTVLISLANGEGQGSGRSVRHFPLHEVLAACGEHLLSHGGHAMAAGVRLRADRVDGFTGAFMAEAGRRLTPRDLRPRLYLDDEVELAELTTPTVETMLRLAPHGPGNPPPRLATGIVELPEPPRVVGRNGNHLQLRVHQNGAWRKAIGFGLGHCAAALLEQRRVRLAFEPIINEWNGYRNVELRIVDWKPGQV